MKVPAEEGSEAGEFRNPGEKFGDAAKGFSGKLETNHDIVPTIPRTDVTHRNHRRLGFLSILIIGI